MTYKKKLIEVALPLEAINKESAREKSIRHGHPSPLHLWWARRPLAACRAVLFASLVDDPSSLPDEFPTEDEQNIERLRLFGIIERFVKWENINNQDVLNEARAEILKSTNGNPPPVYDPFCGGGSIPLEAQRLGLEAHGSDLNPVAVLITKALIEIPPKFKDLPPVNPASTARAEGEPKKGKKGVKNKDRLMQWFGAQGLADDVRYYGAWMRDEAFKKIGHLYPNVSLPDGGEPTKSKLGRSLIHDSSKATVIAWIWARTVKCPNPSCGCAMPLVRSFALSTKKDKDTKKDKAITWIEYEIERSGDVPKVIFTVKTGSGEPPEATVSRKGARCIACESDVKLDHVRDEGKAGRMEAQLMAIVAEANKGRIYFSPTEEHEEIAKQAQPIWKPDTDLIGKAAGNVPLYGMTKHADLFTSRQLVALTTFSDLVSEAKEKVITNGGTEEYASAIATYLALGVSRLSDICNNLCTWGDAKNQAQHLFTRQAIPMHWDFAEPNIFASAAGDFKVSLSTLTKVIEQYHPTAKGYIQQKDARNLSIQQKFIFSTDPPYYDNISYADLSDFFYVWLRRSLINIYPSLFTTLLVPKASELISAPYRFDGDQQKAKDFFENGLKEVFLQINKTSHVDYPFTIYYAFKQMEIDNEDLKDKNTLDYMASTGWETMLEGLIQSSFTVTGTIPMRTERSARSVSIGTNALASSIVLVCRPRPDNATSTTRRQFLNELKRDFPDALKKLQQGNIAPVDLAQASIGPGMAVYSKYAKVLEPDGSAMRVRTALQLINQALDEYFAEQEGEFDTDTRWALAWFEQSQFNEGAYGDAETLSTAKNISVQGLVNSGILYAKGGKVRLLKRDELPAEWNPDNDNRVSAWEVAHHLIRALDKLGETGAANLLAQVGIDKGETAKDLSYRLYSICDRKGWTQLALDYNSLVISWQAIVQLAIAEKKPTTEQGNLFNT